jgi:hypothetical protein
MPITMTTNYYGRLEHGSIALARLWNDHWTIRVFLNGEEQRHCNMADTDAGEIRRTKLDRDGNIVTAGDTIVEEILKGNVEIRLERPDDRDINSMGLSH